MNIKIKSLDQLSLFVPIIFMVFLLIYPIFSDINYYFNIIYLALIPGIPLLVKSIFQFFQGTPMYIAAGKGNNIFYRYFYLSISIILLFLASVAFMKLFVWYGSKDRCAWQIGSFAVIGILVTAYCKPLPCTENLYKSRVRLGLQPPPTSLVSCRRRINL